MRTRSVRVLVRGIVQGVGYRAFVEREAVARGLSGWVRNRRDASVEAVFCGPADGVASLIEACQTGPRLARVVAVEVDELKESFAGPFEVRPSL